MAALIMFATRLLTNFIPFLAYDNKLLIRSRYGDIRRSPLGPEGLEADQVRILAISCVAGAYHVLGSPLKGQRS